MDRVANQARVALGMLHTLQHHWRKDRALPQKIEALIKADPRFGSRDRRLYRELLYTAVRYQPWVEPLLSRNETEAMRRIAWLSSETIATSALRAGLAGSLPALPPTLKARAEILGEKFETLFPDWMAAEAPEGLLSPEAELQRSRAPLWIRLQTDRPERVFQALEAKGWSWWESKQIPGAIRVETESDLTALPEYEDGLFEVQDIGSQAILAAIRPEPGSRWLDACAGAGGKSLQLAGLLGGDGRVDATDIRRDALAELRRRATRARLGNQIRVGVEADAYDGVLVDAPCSGSGTWRRSPHLLWMTSKETLLSYQKRQAELLTAQARKVRKGGLLVYATCSQAASENAGAIREWADSGQFQTIKVNPGYGKPVASGGVQLGASDLDGDCYYFVALKRVH